MSAFMCARVNGLMGSVPADVVLHRQGHLARTRAEYFKATFVSPTRARSVEGERLPIIRYRAAFVSRISDHASRSKHASSSSIDHGGGLGRLATIRRM